MRSAGRGDVSIFVAETSANNFPPAGILLTRSCVGSSTVAA